MTLNTLERAIAIAAEAHAGQADKGGAPYILHPLRVMLAMSGDDERIAAVLHDVCEDCPAWSLTGPQEQRIFRRHYRCARRTHPPRG